MSLNMHNPESEKTEEELEAAYRLYVLSKTVDGRFCPTPDLSPHYSDEEYDNDNFIHTERENMSPHNAPPSDIQRIE